MNDTTMDRLTDATAKVKEEEERLKAAQTRVNLLTSEHETAADPDKPRLLVDLGAARKYLAEREEDLVTAKILLDAAEKGDVETKPNILREADLHRVKNAYTKLMDSEGNPLIQRAGRIMSFL